MMSVRRSPFVVLEREQTNVERRTQNAERRPIMTSQSVAVVNQLGIHARAAAKFVHLATRFEARVRVGLQAREIDGKSIMGILLLAAARGSIITITADGRDETDAIAALVALVATGFGEDPCGA
jgi:phosphocarrier protein HPr